MTDVTVKSLAIKIKIPVELLIQQFAAAGLNKTAVDVVTSREKEILLVHLSKGRKIVSNKLALQRKTRSTLNIPSIGGKSKKVQVEVRKKRIYVTQEPQICRQDMSDEQINEVKSTQSHKCSSVVDYTNKIISKEDIRVVDRCSKNFSPSCQNIDITHVEYKVKEITHRKIKAKCKVQEVTKSGLHHVMKSNKNNKNNVSRRCLDSLLNVNQNDNMECRHTTLHHTLKMEEKNNNKIGNDRRSRTRIRPKDRAVKSIKFKKNNNYVMYYSNDEHEELHSINRNVKAKQRKLNNSNLIQAFNKPTKIVNRDVIIGETITVAELANKMAVKSSYLIKNMMNLGIMATINQIIDQDTAQLITEEMGHNVILHRENALEELVMNDRNRHIDMLTNTVETRAPVVTIMGHVDHGKTSLLDYIRSTKVASTEAGGITQHIGAYHVETANGMITFLDTPGHSAFTAMRARGTKVTDIVILVVAADDGVKLQTIEAIKHAKVAQVPIIVAINKIDKSDADPERIKNELVQHGVIPEEWGGDSQFVNISAKLGIGINNLLEAVLLQAEILELKTICNGMASGIVIESYVDKGRGPVATVLVREGMMKRGDIVLCGCEYGRIRYMRNEVGRDIYSAGPSIPVEVFGLSGSPIAGDLMTVVRDEKKAREVALYRQGKFREVKLTRQKKSKLQDIFFNVINESSHRTISELKIVLKSDLQGSSEAIVESLQTLSTDKVKIKIIYSSVGSITETDVALAVASNAVLLGFNVRADSSARRIINIEKIDVRYYSVIYDLINEVKKTLNGLFVPECRLEIIGLAEVRNVFRSPKYGVVAGCIVTEGIVKRHSKIRILRNNIVIYEGELESLRRFKDDVNEVRNGVECGIGIKNFLDICSSDMIEVFEIIKD
ncbi:translation initiation factor IF-2 [Blochmannia endosymbiont of Camponotus (Colobopsis) obliquus]|uniref:translation initiation factor IF-2 n=1 Tax=Blochmannia endosymbiont of Camponotus (Colobopsis) obliquus TaxID=1505597 RepID=UPI00061A5412|nr:translation initiation factor IF-2 [Blochmannia endosymbiont of Camponotus (Colobopsis) obliquus]AKC60281.1 translation initiation factor IF-2 [Blochmannia endosymbiont of Camponotus (Colobopsis) obliquus]